jgi:hypothetical protein
MNMQDYLIRNDDVLIYNSSVPVDLSGQCQCSSEENPAVLYDIYR